MPKPAQPQQQSTTAKPKTDKMGAWNTIADVVLAVLLQDHETKAFEHAFWYVQVLPRHFPPGDFYQLTYETIVTMRGENESITPQAVTAASDGAIPIQWLLQRWSLYDDLQGEAFETNVKRLVSFGVRYIDIMNARKFQEMVVKEKDRQAAVSWLIGELSNNSVDNPADPTFGSIVLTIREEMEQEPPPTVSTGNDWLDEMLGGFIPGKLWVLGGRFKDRKTSQARNLMLGASRPRASNQTAASITMASYEVRQIDMVYDLLAMLAVEWFVKNNKYQQMEMLGGYERPMVDTFNGQTLQLTRKNWRKWHKDKRDAWEYALSHDVQIARALRVYDRTKNGGRIYDPASLRIKVQKDRDAYGEDLPFVLLIDHIQILGDQAIDLTPRTERYMNELQELASGEQIQIVVLSQLNELTVKMQRSDKNSGNKTRSPGGKGGGALHSACDVFLTTRYGLVDDLREVHPEWLDITIELARNAPSNQSLTQRMLIHPASGYILGRLADDD